MLEPVIALRRIQATIDALDSVSSRNMGDYVGAINEIEVALQGAGVESNTKGVKEE